jgi:hypothetical protein
VCYDEDHPDLLSALLCRRLAPGGRAYLCYAVRVVEYHRRLLAALAAFCTCVPPPPARACRVLRAASGPWPHTPLRCSSRGAVRGAASHRLLHVRPEARLPPSPAAAVACCCRRPPPMRPPILPAAHASCARLRPADFGVCGPRRVEAWKL